MEGSDDRLSRLEEELASLKLEYEGIKLENASLRVEVELLSVRCEVAEMKAQMTPRPGSHKQLLSTRTTEAKQKRRLPEIPAYVGARAPSIISIDVPRTPEAAGRTKDSLVTPLHGINEANITFRRPKASTKPVTRVKAATYDGVSSWRDFKAHFETCAEINGWSYVEQGLYLAVSLRGQAQGVLSNLAGNARDYDSLVLALEERFAPPNQTELYRVQLRERRQRASESLAELGQDIRRLTNLAYPSAPMDVRETLAKEQFLDALHNVEMRLRVKQSRPVSLNDAIRHAVELEAFNKAERAKVDGQGIVQVSSSENVLLEKMEKLQTFMQEMSKELNILKKRAYTPQHSERAARQGSERRCYGCGSKEHVLRNCPTRFRRRGGQRPQAPSLKQEKPRESVGRIGSGLYLPAKCLGVSLLGLIDTGASISVLSSRVWDVGTQEARSTLMPYDTELYTASGDPLRVKGVTELSVGIGDEVLTTKVVVADIDCDLLLGLDFMEAHCCKLDLVRQKIEVRGKLLQLKRAFSGGCYRVRLSKDTLIPARTEVVVQGSVLAYKNDCTGPYLVEPSKKMLEKGTSLVARSLVDGSSMVPVRIMNVSEEDQLLHQNTVVASLSPVLVELGHRSLNKRTDVPKHLHELYSRSVQGMEPEQQKSVAELLTRHSSAFSTSDEDLGRTGVVRHKINTGDAQPIKQPLRRAPVYLNADIDEQISDMLRRGIIQPSTSPWASGIVMVTKKDGTKRFCVDYRRLNDVTLKDSYPLPRIDDSLDQLAGAQWFSCLDLNAGYWQVELDEADREKTAFSSRQGLFEFRVMPFGLCNAPATFERLMETVLAGLNWQICLIYLDDVIVHGRTFEEMLHNLDQVFTRLSSAGLKLKPKKCQLFRDEVQYLGHIVSRNGIRTDPAKVEAIREWPEPRCLREVRSFLGLCGYYRRFIRDFAKIAKPLHRLTEKGEKFDFDTSCRTAFATLKRCLTEAPVLAHPNFNEQFILDTDACENGVAAVLSQKVDGVERPVAFASRTLSKSERRYCVTRKELLAVVCFVKHFRHFLYGKPFLVRTDHSSLRWLLNFKNPEGQLARWLEVLSSYDMKIEHRPGKYHGNADSLSRRICRQCGRQDSCIVADRIAQVECSTVDLKSAQERDEDITRLKQWIESGKCPERKDLESESAYMKSLVAQFECIEVHEGVVMRRCTNSENGKNVLQGIVPLTLRREVLKHSHDIRASGHLGMKKTLARVRQGFYWPGLRNDVRTYVNGCEACVKRKDPTKSKRAPMGITRSGFPMERIAVDILGELPMTERGNKYILVIGDYFTKWMECHPMPNMETKTVASILLEQVVTRFGVPRVIHSDQGRQFESALFSEMCSLLQIKKTRTTPYHPQSDGMVERFNRTLTTMLSAYVDEHHKDWDEHLQYVLMAYRSTENETTGFSPNQLMLGREASTPLDLMYEMPTKFKQIPVNEWVWEIQDKLESAHRVVRRNTEASMKRQKLYHDAKVSFETFEVGDKVLVYFPVKRAGCSSKLTSFWRGPYEIRGKLSPFLYQVNCGQRGSEQVVHCDRLRKVRSQVLPGDETVPKSVSIESGENEVESESGCKRKRNRPVWINDYYLYTCKAEVPVLNAAMI